MKNFRIVLYVFFGLFFPFNLWAHTTIKDLEGGTTAQVGWQYTQLGFEHILPLGFDHILFIILLFFVAGNLKNVLKYSLTFTLGHSISLVLSVLGVVAIPAQWVEPFIALSISALAFRYFFSIQKYNAELGIVLSFGLLHGLGFASVLSEIGLPQSKILLGLFTFNIGIEIGQLCIILILFAAQYFVEKYEKLYWFRFTQLASICIFITGIYWMFERFHF